MNSTALKPVFSMRLDWSINTESLFSVFACQPWAILLDSADAEHIDAQYDVICVAPIATLVSNENDTTITRGVNRAPLYDLSSLQTEPAAHTTIINQQDPFTVLQQTLTELFPETKSSELPFAGGAMGSFSYDLARKVEKLPSLAANDITLPIMNIGIYDWAIIYDYQQSCWTLVHYQSQQALTTLKKQLEGILGKAGLIPPSTLALTNTPSKVPTTQVASTPFRLISPWHNQIDTTAYHAKFNQIQNYLHSGDCYQINLTQRFSSQYEGDEWQAYLALRSANSAPFSAFIRLPHHAVLSISPERFISLQGDKIQTKPIKGTMSRDPDPLKDKQSAQILADSEKDRAENLMIVDLLRNDIGRVATPGSVTVPKLFDIESFPAVHHLVSTVTATLKETLTATDLLQACFPGGSITGAPKIRAMAIIEELEPSRRSLYCGSIGYISQSGTMDTSITIRTLVAEQAQQANTLYCWAGGGIVADSHVDAEYQETFDKVSKILPVLSRINQEA
ncbi:aminodeoxychorismate synthase component I [Shewanella youngdeokensis]|uniref:aminodeoxychorismate synthase n=1 Tax=Shewanella youngdeokensis TaxID=2999068 RepID=A0ABZ0JTM7_9GAMM|nr:aminodeoxychorismate synthase component I [Shewanella sp. DAU334]